MLWQSHGRQHRFISDGISWKSDDWRFLSLQASLSCPDQFQQRVLVCSQSSALQENSPCNSLMEYLRCLHLFSKTNILEVLRLSALSKIFHSREYTDRRIPIKSQS